jgi:hypothetical protein
MSATKTETLRFTRWHGGQQPTLTLMVRNLEAEGLRAFKWSNKANYRYGVRSHGFAKTLYCVEGSVEIFFPDSRQRVTLKTGDRLDIGAGVRHSMTVGLQGVMCLEGTSATRR